MRNWLSMGVQLALLMVLNNVAYGQNEHPVAAPDSVILSGYEYGDRIFFTTPTGTSWEYSAGLLATTPAGTFPVQGPPGFTIRGYFVLPALAPAGDRIAWGFSLPDSDRTKCDPSTVVACALPGPTQYKSVMGVYSLRDKTWKTYGDFCDRGVGSEAFSPDGTKIAFSASMRTQNSKCDVGSNTRALLILDLVTGQFTRVPNATSVVEKAQISWSPDGRHLAVQMDQITLIEIGSWAQTVIIKGENPSWSPKGDWIAYDVGAGMACMIAHPDGTDAKLILDAFARRGWSNWGLDMGTVWSPDGKTLWLSEQADTGKMEVVSVDLATGKVKKMPKGTPSIFGWVLLPVSAVATDGRRSDNAPER